MLLCFACAGAARGCGGAGIRAQRAHIHEPSGCGEGGAEAGQLPQQALHATAGAAGPAGPQKVGLVILRLSVLKVARVIEI